MELGQARETVNDLRCEMREVFKGFHNRLFGEGKPLADKYREVDFLARLHCETGDALHLRIKSLRGDFAPCSHAEQISVFVGYVEVMDGPQRVIPSGVWFQLLHESNDLRTGPLYVTSRNRILKAVLPLAEGKRDLLDQVRRRLDHLENKQIERRPNVVDSVTGNEAHFELVQEISRYYLDTYPHMTGFLRCVLKNDGVRVTLAEGFDLGVKINDVLIGPLNLEPGSSERCHG